MANRRPFRRRRGVVTAATLAGVLFAIAGVFSMAAPESHRPDVLTIDLPPTSESEAMPAVQFLHDAHTERVPEDHDCSACHLKNDQGIVFKYMRLADKNTEADMAIYHANCIACHEKAAAEGNPSGPVTGACRSCHRTQPEFTSSRVAISFDKSLHYRHESSQRIRPRSRKDTANCSACHHVYDKARQKTVYAKGDEGSCRYCHRETKTETGAAFRKASHEACVNCHLELASEQEKAGPIKCAGCHSAKAQQTVAKLVSVPRMKRNQPDFALLASWMTGSMQDAELAAVQMNPVPFNHVVHESANQTCRVCHHETLKKCAACHTETGRPDGGSVQLAMAMHAGDSERSCIGCHKTAQRDPNCAGCHAGMPAKPFAKENCSLCHRIDRHELGPWPMDAGARRQAAARAFQDGPNGQPSIPDEQIPENVIIDALAKDYERVNMPHRQIIRRIEALIADNRMAGHFHDRPTTLCMGCHHNSPTSLKPPKCASCHGEAFQNLQDDRPGLMGAYHGQCIQCHQNMGIREPAATDCNKCHKPKSG